MGCCSVKNQFENSIYLVFFACKPLKNVFFLKNLHFIVMFYSKKVSYKKMYIKLALID